MNYPLNLTFKIVALAPQLSITDTAGNLHFYVKQKLFKLKEAITVYADAEQRRPLYQINADRVIDFSPRFNITDSQGMPVGAIKRQGARSLWRSHYDILDGDRVVLTIREENPWTKVIDSLFGNIPVAGMFSGYVFNPAYVMTRPDGSLVMRLQKQPAFLEGKFTIENHGLHDAQEEQRALLGLLTMVLLERSRG